MAQNDGSSSRVPPVRPTVALPPRSSMETLFSGSGASPGPMTLVSNFFSDNDPDSECRSFSQLLAGAMAWPATVPAAVRQRFQTPTESSAPRGKESGVGDTDFRFKQSRPTGLMVTQPAMFTIPPGLSPASLLDSPGFFPPVQGAFGLSHQQALAHVSSQVAQAQPQLHIPAEYSSLSSGPPPSSSQLQSLTSNKNSHQQMAPPVADPNIVQESSDISLPDQRSQPAITVVKPADDGYNWRKYGQKQVKGSECPRSYYKCTHANCPVKKKVERSQDGQVTEIMYKGQHNHRPPQPIKRSKDAENSNGTYNLHGNSNQESMEGLPSHSLSNQEFCQATPEQVCGSSESEEVGDTEAGIDGRDDDEPESKRRNLEARSSEQASSHRTVTEPRIIVQTTSEVDLLDDGYRWRKYGQKVVKGNPYPRSYYKCTSQGCNVRKHVERAASDPKAVITTYEGKHNHDVPAAKSRSHATANMVSQLRPQNSVPDNQYMARMPEFKSNGQQPVASLRFKEEQIT